MSESEKYAKYEQRIDDLLCDMRDEGLEPSGFFYIIFDTNDNYIAEVKSVFPDMHKALHDVARMLLYLKEEHREAYYKSAEIFLTAAGAINPLEPDMAVESLHIYGKQILSAAKKVVKDRNAGALKDAMPDLAELLNGTQRLCKLAKDISMFCKEKKTLELLFSSN